MDRIIDQVVQNAKTTGNGDEADCKGLTQQITAYVTGASGVTSGAVQLETSDVEGYAGTWAPLGSAITVVGGAKVISTVVGTFKRVRARISTTVAGGSAPGVTVRIVGI